MGRRLAQVTVAQSWGVDVADEVSSLYSGIICLWEADSVLSKLMILELRWQFAQRLECLGPRQGHGETQVLTGTQRGEPGRSREVPQALLHVLLFLDSEYLCPTCEDSLIFRYWRHYPWTHS